LRYKENNCANILGNELSNQFTIIAKVVRGQDPAIWTMSKEVTLGGCDGKTI